MGEVEGRPRGIAEIGKETWCHLDTEVVREDQVHDNLHGLTIFLKSCDCRKGPPIPKRTRLLLKRTGLLNINENHVEHDIRTEICLLGGV